MNYFRVQGALIAGIQPIPVQVECAQSRRLPYLQILGGSAGAAAELRERVIAALDSCQLRLPSRRFTVQLQPAVPALPLEQLDLAVAIALLGSAQRIPPASVDGLLICGGLGLDGSLRADANRGALVRRLVQQGGLRSALVPWELREAVSPLAGGGFRHLSELVEFLRGGTAAVAGPSEGVPDPEAVAPPPSQVWSRICGQAIAKRALEIAAAGSHHLLLRAPPEARPDLLAHALSSLLPPLGEPEHEEVRAVYALAALPAPSRPFHAYASAPALPPLLPDRRLAKVEEALLAHRGVLFVDQLCEREPAIFPDLLPPMLGGRFLARLGSRRVEVPADPIVVGSSASCPCGGQGSDGPCTCRPTEARRYQERWRRLLRHPFDLSLVLRVERGAAGPWDDSYTRVLAARARSEVRGRGPNARLGEEGVFAALPWSESARRLWSFVDLRGGAGRSAPLSLARIALTICDLREGGRLEESDLLEARHYLAGAEEGTALSRAGASSAVPATNSSAMP